MRISILNSTDLFACKWLRAPATKKDEGLADAAAANPFRLHPGISVARSGRPPSRFTTRTLAAFPSGSCWASLGYLFGEKSERHWTLLDSRPACEEGSCMDPARSPEVVCRLVFDSQSACGQTP
jgi:hypothetical protein